MDKNCKINWLYIISIKEFQNNLNLNLLKEISMVSKLTRDKLNPLLFKNLKLSLVSIKFDSNVINMAYDMQHGYSTYDYSALRDENNGSIENSLNEYINAIDDIKKYTKSFYLTYNQRVGYYLYPIVKVFDNLTELKIFICDFPFGALVGIGKTLPNLNRLEMQGVNLVKSTNDTISESNIAFPPKLSYMKLFSLRVTSSTLLYDPYEYLFNFEDHEYFYEHFTLPKISIPSLKRLDFKPKDDENHRIEEFLEANPNVESLLTRDYKLNVSNSLNALKSLDIDECISFNNIDQDFRLNSINSLILSTRNFSNSENIIKLCQLCPNLANLSISFLRIISNLQPIIDNFLVPISSNLNNLKSLALFNVIFDTNGHTLDFSKLAHIKKLLINLNYGSVLNIKFDNCKSLKIIELLCFEDSFTDEFKMNLNQHNNWKFKFSKYGVKGYKI
ncbi:hypothetical protein CONCODRAFT_73517 [Conidiobolus coronatus NRRL 28638]|uniref:RNI-like protein n=1 Tax=Conidiobolus coronatus (strain ATCC 28846 / CBS 209.66 / NRRL 28638) TaxID=796925 RepID=A0A137NV44_CONC2|nr:hypothetical protein CONCODRAFT_73517 [Conidiobolus coronatus NRRL 28638]|eukprot:KXN66685.1 hypothetical protein CONCODRAFT_73517 [Conidiobolus coronatus NRRL 28638]